MLVACGWFLTTSTYSRKEAAIGWLAPEEGLVRISSSEAGQIERTLIEQGSNVVKGDTLFILSQDKKLLSGRANSDDLLQILEQEKLEIQRQVVVEKKSQIADVNDARKSLIQLQKEKTQLEDQIIQQSDRVDIQKEIYEKYSSLREQEQAVSYIELQVQNESYTAQKQSLAALRQRISTLERDIISTESVLTRRPLDSERVQSELTRRMIEISNREVDLKTIGAQAIQAPITGTVATLEIQTGNTVYPRQLLASILPQDSELFAEVYIPSRAIGFIKRGQNVRLMYTAFPHQRFGAAKGTVLEVSNTVLRPEEIPTAIGLEEPGYKARIKLDNQSMDGFGETLDLRPGMALRAEIILEKRSFLQWVLEPLRARRVG